MKNDKFLGSNDNGDSEIKWDSIDIKDFKPYATTKQVPTKDRVKIILDMPTKEAFKLKKQIEVPHTF